MKIYAEVLEKEALEQFEDAMKQDFVVDGALMPDAHLGYALPIGSVVSTSGHIVPAWVGYDIGCTDKGWKKISDYNNEKIMAYDIKSVAEGKMTLQSAQEMIKVIKGNSISIIMDK